MERTPMEMGAAGGEEHAATYAEAHEEEHSAEAPHEEHGEAPHEDDYREDEYVEGHDEHVEEGGEEPEQKSTLAKRFAARRAKRSEDKAGGGSLTSRLRSLVADSAQTRG
ncbi:hypothetical protein AUC71_03975 [Methyloceanibacter marginalis]|uniref:Uncharacterized protein n=1 Tax=Methyloceanibacter marginalis TaxID=1774971 RepID=A0A1E3VW55_9HYPH|nr:hypothetical protein AUC71_03975 [Methyloceanibacter marginalis]